ncbi:hypothetical protein KQX54_020176 [Cotesia glomerata]|uniref:Uncharacterized protein n=1 Tax=Cotesia glomerata TaxID=32391 RepID=A0AAV7IHN8_COTGL|nr:hypothetical protein KQX54_020176 [Cotesia glomerata]
MVEPQRPITVSTELYRVELALAPTTGILTTGVWYHKDDGKGQRHSKRSRYIYALYSKKQWLFSGGHAPRRGIAHDERRYSRRPRILTPEHAQNSMMLRITRLN